MSAHYSAAAAHTGLGEYAHSLYALCMFILLQIIQVNLTMDQAVPCVEGAKLDFTYAVTWHATSVSFEDRFHRYLDNGFFEHKASREGRKNNLHIYIFQWLSQAPDLRHQLHQTATVLPHRISLST